MRRSKGETNANTAALFMISLRANSAVSVLLRCFISYLLTYLITFLFLPDCDSRLSRLLREFQDLQLAAEAET